MKSRPSVSKPRKSRLRFIGDTIGELKKVVWPTRQEALRLTIMVIAVCLAVGLVLGAIDYGFTELVTRFFLHVK